VKTSGVVPYTVVFFGSCGVLRESARCSRSGLLYSQLSKIGVDFGELG